MAEYTERQGLEIMARIQELRDLIEECDLPESHISDLIDRLLQKLSPKEREAVRQRWV